MITPIQNVIDGQGVQIALTGMLIVFSGLSLIALFLTYLPRVLARWHGPRTPRSTRREAHRERRVSEEENIHAAIALVVHMELASHESDNQRVTLDVDESTHATWALSTHRMRHFPH